MDLTILGLGTAAPANTLTQKETAEIAKATVGADATADRFIDRIYHAAGIQTRGSVLDDGSREPGRSLLSSAAHAGDLGPAIGNRMTTYAREAPLLAALAARRALEAAGVPAGEISHLITASCTGFVAPGLDAALVADLGLHPGVSRTHIGFMGCHGAINALRAAHGLATLHPGSTVLVCAAELCSLHFRYETNPQSIIANALFADGAGAIVARAVPVGSAPLRLVATGSTIVPQTADLMRWVIGDHGFEMTLSPRVPDVVRDSLAQWMACWLAEHGLRADRIGSWAVHPGGPKILDVVQSALHLSPTALLPSRRVLATHGNMSSPTVIFILEELLSQQAQRPIVALAFGPGLAIEAALFA